MHARSGSTMRSLPVRTGALLLLGWLVLSPAVARAAIFTVGGDAACTHRSIQAALNAAQSAQVPSVVRIARNAAYTQQALLASPTANLELAGGYASCTQSAADHVRTRLDGAGGVPASVLRIVAPAGVAVIVRRLIIQRGDPAGDNAGGGIFFGGSGTLEVHDVDFVSNVAGNGGAIYAGGAAPGARLVIGANVLISGNTARYSGGGVFVDGLDMTMTEPGSLITNNSALGTATTGYGGGVFVRSLAGRSARVRIGSAGIGMLGAVANNRARCGGGVAIREAAEGSGARASLLLYRTNASRPAAITYNRATEAGGGVFVQGGAGGGVESELWNAEITDNQAPSGAAVYLTYTAPGFGDPVGASGGILKINTQRPSGAVACAPGVPCGTIAGNVAALSDGQATDGAIIQLQAQTRATIGTSLAGVVLEGNQGGRLLDVQPQAHGAQVVNALIVDNALSVHLLRAQGGTVAITDSTIAGNAIGSRDVLAVNANLELRRGILWQPGMRSLSRSGGLLSVSDMIVSEAATLGGAPLAIVADPRFVDAAHGDYRVHAASPAVDYAPPIPGDDRDVSGSPRDQDLPLRPNAEGPRDVGAFERLSIDPLVGNAAFVADLRLWEGVHPGTVAFDGTQSVGAGSGSAGVSGAPINGLRLVGARQCVHLPGPGRYRLNGYGMTQFATTLHRDSVVLNWALRRDGTEQCDIGPIDASGDHLLTRGNAWFRPAEPAVIELPAEAWTPNSSLTVSLVMIDAGIAFPAQVQGWFDEITLEAQSLDNGVAADGFGDAQ